MALPELMDIYGVGEKRYEKIFTVMQRDNIALAEVYAMSPESIKARFGMPINVARKIANVNTTPEIVNNTPSATSELEKMPSVDRPLTDDDIRTLQRNDEDYPQKLRDRLGDDAPETLHVWGNLDLLNRHAVGFCGSRSVTNKGLDVTEDVAEQISDLGWVVVSGHARGVDAKAHLTALRHNAGTIIVLPQGLHGFKLRTALRKYATQDNVLLISEFPLHAGWHVGYAMQRNATIIGLSDAMVVVESRSKGGTFNAGKTALKMGHPLFVVKFQDTSKSNAGNNYFLQRGAIQLMKSKTTNRANISTLKEKVTHKSQSLAGRNQQRTLFPVSDDRVK